jgi:hypothetical protein
MVVSALLFYGCVSHRPGPPAAKAPPYLINRPLVEAPASVKANDFRFNPPEVLDITVKKLGNGQALMAVRYAEDKRLGSRVTLLPDEDPIGLHDDGRAGDAQAGDHVFSAIVPLDVDSLAEAQDRLLAALADKKAPLVVPKFRGREIVGEEKIDPAEIARLWTNGIVKLVPFGAGGPLSDPKSTLLITDTSVVGDPVRTFDPCTGAGTPLGKWTFGYLMTQMAGNNDPSDFVMNWLQTWLSDQTVNGFTVQQRTQMQNQILNNWPKLPDGRLDVSRSPMKLLAIVNRIDLASNMGYGKGGGAEGRFVFTPTFPPPFACTSSNFDIILEYGVPVHDCMGIRSWARQWLNLQNFTLGSPPYNAALEAITEQFAAAKADPARPNGSALDQLRTDEIQLNQAWELREFQIGADGQLHEVTVKQTPDKATYNQGGPQAADLATWINNNSAAIKAGTYTVTPNLPFPPGDHFLGGEVTNSLDPWNAPGIVDNESRHDFSKGTCNGCHGAETRTGFIHVFPNPSGGEAFLSGFLIGDGMGGPFIVTDPVDHVTQYQFHDLLLRAQILQADASDPCPFSIRNPVLLFTD